MTRKSNKEYKKEVLQNLEDAVVPSEVKISGSVFKKGLKEDHDFADQVQEICNKKVEEWEEKIAEEPSRMLKIQRTSWKKLGDKAAGSSLEK